MSQHRNPAERIRPYLQAMEQSILAARRRRLHQDEEPAVSTNPPALTAPTAAVTPATPAVIDGNGTAMVHDPDANPSEPPRLRARPKRASVIPNPGMGSVHSQAG